MQDTVLPEMTTLFQGYSETAFGDFSCQTCHGEDMGAVDYAMPNGAMALPGSAFPLSGHGSPRISGFGEFMEDTVLPKMVELLGTTEFDSETGEGFGCYGCHENYSDPDPWEDLDTEGRREFMNWEVFEPMKALFQDFDATEYADFDCETCHGDNMWAVDFDMPNGGPALSLSGFPFSQSSDPEEAAYGEFMEDDVIDDFVEILDITPFNPQTGEGFGCYGCHELDPN
jgi:hypothetical protein